MYAIRRLLPRTDITLMALTNLQSCYFTSRCDVEAGLFNGSEVWHYHNIIGPKPHLYKLASYVVK